MIDLTTKISTLDGKPVPFSDGSPEAAVDATIGAACIVALLNDLTGSPSPEEKARRFILAQRMVGAQKIELAAEDVTRIKHVVGNIYSALIVGRVWEAIDPASLK